jgi:hypothetical protein
LIEWKYINPGLDDSSRAAITIRVQELGKLLYQAKGKGFKVPQCVAIYTASQFQLGYVFSTPSTNPGELCWYTLGDRLRPLQTNKGKQTPILGDRFRLAYTLAKAFYLLHCAAWLHKRDRRDWLLEAADVLGARVGAVYRDVAKRCLEQDSLDDTSKTKDLNSVLLEDVVEALERCMA